MFYSFVSKMREIHNKIENKTYVQLVHISGLFLIFSLAMSLTMNNTHWQYTSNMHVMFSQDNNLLCLLSKITAVICALNVTSDNFTIYFHS